MSPFSGRRQGGRNLHLRLIIAAAIALFSLFSYFSSSVINPVTGEKQHIGGISVDKEIALGLQAAPQMMQMHGGKYPDSRVQQRVARVGRRIVEQSDARKSPYEFDFHVLRDERTVNAFALPGGQIFITKALLDRLQTEGQLAGVLAHEIAHVIARHGAEHLAKQQLTQGLTGAAVIATYDPQNPRSRASAAVAVAIGQLVNLRYGRSDELESDRLGVRFMAQAGYDPRAMIGVMEVLRAASRGGAPPEFFSSHPNPENRVGRIEQAIRELYPQGVPEGLEE